MKLFRKYFFSKHSLSITIFDREATRISNLNSNICSLREIANLSKSFWTHFAPQCPPIGGDWGRPALFCGAVAKFINVFSRRAHQATGKADERSARTDGDSRRKMTERERKREG